MTKAHQIYKELLTKGLDAKDAAKEAQARTGISLVTGEPIRLRTEHKLKNKYRGLYG